MFLIMLIPVYSFAQECKERMNDWDPPSVGTITAWTAPVCDKGEMKIQPYFFYNYIRGVFNSEGHFKHFKDREKMSEFQEVLFLQYGLFERFEISAQGIYQQVLVNNAEGNAAASGFNDTYIFSRYCLLDETEWLPATTALFQLKLPTGKYQNSGPDMAGSDIMTASTGGGSYEEGCGLIFTKRIKPFILHADFLFGFPNPARVDGVNMRYGSYFNYNGAVEYFFYDHFNLLAEANGLIQGDSKEDGRLTPSTSIKYLALTAGLGWSDEKIQMLIAYQRAVAGTNTNVNDSVVATFVYTF